MGANASNEPAQVIPAKCQAAETDSPAKEIGLSLMAGSYAPTVDSPPRTE
jgi:hypothetical protein